MDRRERIDDDAEAMIVVLDGHQANIWTSIPAIIQDFDPVRQTCSAQPALMMQIRNPEGVTSWQALPLLTDVPVHFPSGGGYTLTFPVQAGDECMVVFSKMCIDAWWQLGGANNVRNDMRQHSLADGIAFVGIKSQPHTIPEISTDSVQLRNDAGDTRIDVKDGTITLKAPTLVKIDAPLTECTGNLVVDGLLTYGNGLQGTAGTNGNNVSGDLLVDTISVKHHLHSGVTTGIGNTGQPVP